MSKAYPPRFTKVKNARECALRCLYELNVKGYSSMQAIWDSSFAELKGDRREEKLALALYYGVLEEVSGLDYLISANSRYKLERLDPLILTALRLALYQIYFMDGIPNRAACSSAVDMVKKYAHTGFANYTNAVLRQILRELPAYPDRPYIKAGVTAELYDYVNSCLAQAPLNADAADLEAFWAAVREKSPLYIRRQNLNCSAEALKRSLELEACSLEELDFSPAAYALNLSAEKSLAELSAFRDGCFIVQGKAAQLPALLLGDLHGKSILELCAAPGGKSLQLYDLSAAEADILACDKSAERCLRMSENFERLRADKIRYMAHDACQSLPDSEKREFDIVWADVPCSSLGLLASQADLRLNTGGASAELLALQREILLMAARSVRVGGLLLYSTCSICPEENQAQVAAFLGAADGAFALKPFPSVPTALEQFDFTRRQLAETPGILNLYPHIHKSEGFFIALLERR